MSKQKKLVPAVITPPGEYEVRGIKTFTGMEGCGYNATLYRSGKKVAAVIDDASGGPLMVEWLDFKKPRIPVKTSKYGGKYKATIQMTPEEKALHDYATSLPPLVSSIEESPGKPMVMDMDMDLFIEELVNQALLMKDLARMTKGKLAFEVDGRIYTSKVIGGDVNRTRVWVMQRHPSAKVLNDMQVQDALAIIKAMQQ